MTLIALFMIIAAYLMGSISSAILVCRALNLPDPRTEGSGNPGATNVLRLGGRLAALLVLVCDMLKGTIPVWLSYYLGANPFLLGLIAVAACLGHMFPIFFQFKGGKGVATALGAIAPIGLDLAGGLIACWLLVVAVTQYSSLAAISAVLAAPLFTWLIKPQFTMPVAMLCCLILWRHQANIRRLIAGEEPKIWNKRKPLPENEDK
ncbi:glycerol-3-phosphate acyltransferase [Veronia nyctiphanis]|uniref:Glycerol-3-phosphate acyltransferase n=1 Tax=Veronia nyctiphanis TaxID=1278244 RepID=A0A4Q0YJA3_9GAMM|nr:glycerol-3-phosphate 1-O-acyltransferase PlsY [Veronia nyctiphanis]RXJ70503.1 glycerol-3-phosphate acyltransferase [Veronia nyctiphanis]